MQKLNEDLFELTSDDKSLFLDKLVHYTIEMGWSDNYVGIVSIFLESYNKDSLYVNIIKHSRMLILE